jgi:hypothetical protein
MLTLTEVACGIQNISITTYFISVLTDSFLIDFICSTEGELKTADIAKLMLNLVEFQ